MIYKISLDDINQNINANQKINREEQIISQVKKRIQI